MVEAEQLSAEQVLEALREVKDPEIRVLDVIDLGIVRDIQVDGDDVVVEITPTYSGCPALDVMKKEISECLTDKGFKSIQIVTKLKPAWTTDWLSEEAKIKLKRYGIAPPGKCSDQSLVQLPSNVTCPYCDGVNTKLTSEFGATACKSLWFCENCQEPFEHFKTF